MKSIFEVRLTKNELGGYDAYIPAIDMITAGSNLNDAAFRAADLLQTALPEFLSEGVTFAGPDLTPKEGQIVIGVFIEAHADDPEAETMSVAGAASMLGVTEGRVGAMARDGVLEARKVGRVFQVSTASVRERVNNPRHAGRPRLNQA